MVNLLSCIDPQVRVPSLEQVGEMPLNADEIHFRKEHGGGFQVVRLGGEPESFDSLRVNWLRQFFAGVLESGTHDIGSISCEFIVHLSDGLGLQPKFAKFCFAQPIGCGNILMPDPHSAVTRARIGGVIANDRPLAEKYKQAVFAGSNTGGQHSPLKLSLREEFCARTHSAYSINARLCNVMRPDFAVALTNAGLSTNIVGSPLSVADQLNYQLIVNIDGNTTSWERLLWAMASNSICVNVKPVATYESWYSPLIDFSCCIPNVQANHLQAFMEDNDFTDARWAAIKARQKELALAITSLKNQEEYFSALLAHYSRKQSEQSF